MAFYSENEIEEVRAANDIVDVIGSYVNLKRKGSSYQGLCPFHHEKTPSFSVSVDKQIFHCFGCGVGGNVVRFIQRIENISFSEAVQLLAERAGIVLHSKEFFDPGITREELEKREEIRNQMYEINKVAGRFFYENIEKSRMAQNYILERRIEPKTVAKFGLGFALNDNSLSKYLISQGFDENVIIATGLIGKSDRGQLYDKFKDRFMFPIFDVRKRLIAFGGRTLESKESMKAKGIPKYINSPENLVYSKGKHLYGLNLAKGTNQKMKRVLVVEGYMDVISPHQAGITNVVASLGTALTEQQGRLLRRYAEEVVLSYDSDEAGQKAKLRGIEIMQALDVPVKVLKMEGAKDPDEYVLKYGPEKFERLIDNSISPVEYKVDMLKKNYNLEDTSQKITFLTKMSEILSKVDNIIERDVYVDKFSRELNVGKEAIIAEIEKRTIRNTIKVKNWQAPKPIVSNSDVEVDKDKENLEKSIIYILTLKNVDIFNILKQVYTSEDVDKSINGELIKRIYNLYETGDIINKDLMSLCDTEEESNLLSEVLMKSNVRDDAERFALDIIRKIEVDKLQNEKKEVIKKLQDDITEEERKSLEAKLNEIILKIAKK